MATLKMHASCPGLFGDSYPQEEEERQKEILEAQIQRAKALAAAEEAGEGDAAAARELQRDTDGQPVQIALAARTLPAQPARPLAAPGFGAADRTDKVRQPPSLPSLTQQPTEVGTFPA